MDELARSATAFVQQELAALGDPDKAPQMQAYMKTEMPFYGVQKAGRTAIMRSLVKQFVPEDDLQYEALVVALWELPHREERYLALSVARRFTEYIRPPRLPLYQRLIVEGAWWDLVDEVATKLIRSLVVEYPDETWPVVDGWSDGQDLWLRRTAIICQIGAKGSTDVGRLFRFCRSNLEDPDFFIRKAIGWALREYAKTDPEAVAEFVSTHREDFSGLSFREATKHISELVS